MSRASGLAALGVAFTAGLTLTLVAVDSSTTGAPEAQRIDTASSPSATQPSSSTNLNRSIELRSDPALLVVASVGDQSMVGSGGDDGTAIGTQRTPLASISANTAGAAESSADAAEQTDTTRAPAPKATAAGQRLAETAPAGPKTSRTTARASGSTGTTTRKPARASQSTAPSSTSAPRTTKAPATTAPPKPAGGQGSGAKFESIRNRNPLFNRYENLPESQISLGMLTETAPVPDNGSNGDGNFRMACAYSHFSYDDPIVFPGQPGKSHLHMFFGNTRTDAHTTTNSLVNSGGGSCNGFELNRSGYWTPALLDGKGNAVVPDQIILYYKSKHPSQVKRMPQGLKMIAGNATKETFTADYKLGWSCGPSGTSYNRSNRIPNNCGGDPINAYIQFPFCWDGRNLDSADHSSHMAYVNDNQSCPSSHPVRLPQISILMYFPAGNSNGWYLSSDKANGFNTGPGATLHADWFGGWHDQAMDLWINGCMVRARNCSYGQTGTSKMFAKLNGLQDYPGNNFLPLPR